MITISWFEIGIIFFISLIFITKAFMGFYFDVSNVGLQTCLKFIWHFTRAKHPSRVNMFEHPMWNKNGPKMILILWMDWLVMIIIISQSRSCCHIIVLNCVLITLNWKLSSVLPERRVLQRPRTSRTVQGSLTSCDKLRWYWLCSKWPSVVWCVWWSWWVV